MNSHRARLFVGAVLSVCYAVEPHFHRVRYQIPLPMLETHSERLIKWAVYSGSVVKTKI